MKKILLIALLLTGYAYGQDQTIGKRTNQVKVVGKLAVDSVEYMDIAADTVLIQGPGGTIKRGKLSRLINYANCTTTKLSGDIIWISGFNFSNTKLTYQIGCQLDTSSASNFSITAADTSDRYTIVWADTLGNLGTTDGTVGAVASIPTIDPRSQILLATYFIPANSTQPQLLSNTVVYKENLGSEWVGYSNIPGVSFIQTNPPPPYEGLYSTYIPSFSNLNDIYYTDGSDHNLSSSSFLSFRIRIGTAFTNSNYIVIYLNGGSGAIGYLPISSGHYGFNGSLVNQWQLVVARISDIIPLSASNTFNQLDFQFQGSGGAVQFDNIILQSGGNNQGSRGVQSVNGATDNVYIRQYINSDSTYDLLEINGVVQPDSLWRGKKTLVAQTNITITPIGVDSFGISAAGGTGTSQWRDTTGGIYYPSGNVGILDGYAYKYGSVNILRALPSSYNYFFGPSGNMTMTGQYNLLSGYGAGASITTASSALLFGVNAGNALTTGGIGGGDVVVLGTSAFQSGNTYGIVAIGQESQRDNIDGRNSTAVGGGTLRYNQHGILNNAFGVHALEYTLSNSNTGLAVNAGKYNRWGANNLFAGAQSGVGNGLTPFQISVNDSNLVVLGTEASRDGTIDSATAINNAIAIGYRAQFSKSNQAVLGNDDITETRLKGDILISGGHKVYLSNVASDTSRISSTTNATKGKIYFGKPGPYVGSAFDESQNFWGFGLENPTAPIEGYKETNNSTGNTIVGMFLRGDIAGGGGSTISRFGDLTNTVDVEVNGGNSLSGVRYGTYVDANIVNNYTGNNQYGNLNFVTNNAIGMRLSNAGSRVSIGSSLADASAAFDVQGTTKGVLFPRLNTTQMNAVSSPYAGLIITNTDSLNRLFIYTGSAWKGLAFTDEGGGGSSSSQIGSVDTGWHRKGVVMTGYPTAEGMNNYEPTVIREGSPIILTGDSIVFKMWYTYGWSGSNRNIAYAESLDGITWVKYASNPVVTLHSRSCVLKNGSTYYMYAVNATSSQMDRYTSSNGVSWTLATSSVIAYSPIYNMSVIIDGSTWRMLVDGYDVGGYKQNYYTSSDGITWTAYGSNPVISGKGQTGPFLKKIGSTYYVWLQQSGGSATLPSDIFRYSSPDMITWTQNSASGIPSFPRRQADEGPQSNTGQVADPTLVAVDSAVYMFYEHTTNGLDSAAGASIKLAIANMPFSQLVRNNEGDGAEVVGIAPATGWLLKGNSSLDSSHNFIGTTDVSPFIIKQNNARKGIISSVMSNVSFGTSLLAITNGTGNTAMGTDVLNVLTTGVNNVGAGNEALHNSTGGNYNVALGFRSQYTNTIGNYNVAIGRNSLKDNTTQSSNTAVGNDAMTGTTGGLNTAVGQAALFSSGAGTENTALGVNSMYTNTSGAHNSALGYASLFGNTTGDYNTAIGYNALNGNTSGGQNIAIGLNAGIGNTTESYQVYINSIYRGGAHSDDQTKSPFYAQQNASMASQKVTLNGNVGINTISPAASAVLDIPSTTQGILPPRMTTTEKNAISSPAEGLMVYDLTLHKLYVWDGSTWQAAW